MAQLCLLYSFFDSASWGYQHICHLLQICREVGNMKDISMYHTQVDHRAMFLQDERYDESDGLFNADRQ